jgi:ASPM-SPD-2-Hydin domain-containing protein
MNRNFLLRLSFTVCFFAPALLASTINVPADQPTIQAAINAASNGDTILVAPGTYTENINFLGKAITVESSKGAKVTIIDGGGVSSVVTFSSNETLSSVLKGFTLRNGNAMNTLAEEGGGIAIEGAAPTIKDNVIEGNLGANAGGGIGIGFASPLIQGNTIQNNSQSPEVDGGVGGGGISVRGAGSAQIIGNVIQNNSWTNGDAGFGGGISLFASGSTLVENNIIEGNIAGTWGGAIAMVNDVSGTSIVQNLIVGNSSPDDAGIYWSDPPAALVNNTITDGKAATGSSTSIVVANGLNDSIVIANNLVVASNVATNGFYCVSGGIPTPLNFYNNDIFSSKGTAYGGTCTDQTGTDGNLSLGPDFVGKSNFRLKGGSPAIDAGSDAAPDLPSTDLAGNSRIINGNDGPTAIIDIGAYEFVPVVFSPKSLSFGTQAIGSSTSKTLRLTNAQDKVLSIPSLSAPPGYSVSGCGASVPAFKSCTLTVTFHPLAAGKFKGELIAADDAGNSPQAVPLSGVGH